MYETTDGQPMGEGHEYTPRVCTTWYRPPELLLSAKSYNTSADMWSCGCVAAEICTGVPIFKADNETEAMHIINKTLGNPAPNTWPQLCSALNELSNNKWSSRKTRINQDQKGFCDICGLTFLHFN